MAALIFLLVLAAQARPLPADDITVKEIGGVPVLRCKIHHGERHIEAHVLFDIGSATPMVIHPMSVGGLELSPREADGQPVDIEFDGGVRWKSVPMRVREDRFLQVLTADYARELKEVPVVAVVGLAAIKSNVVELNLRKGLLRTLGMASDEARSAEIDYEAKRYGIVLGGTGPSEAPLKALLVMRSQDSILDRSFLDSARKAGIKPNVLDVGGVKFSDHAAFRFRPLAEVAPDRLGALLGTSAMRDFTVTVWPKRKKIAFIPQATAKFPRDEQDFFFALADKNPDGVVEFIGKGPTTRRLLDEACISLWQMRLEDSDSTPQMLKKALETIGSHYNAIRRSTVLTRIADELEEGDRSDKEDLAMLALELAMEQSGVALDQTAVHGVHVRLGKKAFAKGDLKQARRHLLSAAFGMPKNGLCNFWLGELYKEMGKPRRAWSRYFQAILDQRVDEQIRADCLARLDELNRDPEFRRTFNMVVAEQYMAGRLEDAEFHAPSRYELAKKKFPGHVKLVEFFTDANDLETGGVQLAFQALDEYFSGRVALIQYHLNDPMRSDVAEKRLEYYQGDWAPLAVFDGEPSLNQNVSQAEKLSENAAGNYDVLRKACLSEKAAAKPEWELDARMTQDGSKVSATVTVTGEGETDNLRLHAVLCERSVMALEDNGVFFHHFVARRSLTPTEGLDLKEALEQPVEFSVDAKEMREDLREMLEGDERRSYRSKPTYVDANKLMVVLFVQHQDKRGILAAESFTLPQEDELL